MRAQALIEMYLHTVFNEQVTKKVKIIWTRLPHNIKTKVDVNKLSVFLDWMDKGFDLESASKHAKISTAAGVDLLDALDKTGLL